MACCRCTLCTSFAISKWIHRWRSESDVRIRHRIQVSKFDLSISQAVCTEPGRSIILESFGIKLLRFPGMKSAGKRHRSWKTPNKSWISLKSWNSKAVVLKILIWVHWSTLRQPHTLRLGLFTLINDLVCALFDLMQTVFFNRMYPGKSYKNVFQSWKTPEFGLCKSWKKYFNICTNPG